MTNEQHIKSLPTKEFAEYLFDRGNCSEYCHGICAYQDECEGWMPESFCIEQICKWLEAEG